MKSKEEVLQFVTSKIEQESLVKIIFSKPRPVNKQWVNVHVKPVSIKDRPHLSFTYRFQTKDETKNYLIPKAVSHLDKLLTDDFMIGNIFTTDRLVTMAFSKKGKLKISNVKQQTSEIESTDHDRNKRKYISQKAKYLKLLGITDQSGQIIPKMSAKFKQINKYLEIIDGLIKNKTWNEPINVVDMGSGKGYLTFALYDFLRNHYGLDVSVIGVELRKELVDLGNDMAEECGFEGLFFARDSIESFGKVVRNIDILIALHACDTATDDAIYTGLSSKAELIICAPCCHKQIRQSIKGKTQDNPLMKHGIFRERELEMVTDTLRSLIMEKHQYKTQIFEFISNEHTRKNVMLVGSKSKTAKDELKIQNEIDTLKSNYKIEEHYLEHLTKG